jgi:hypothetical protein
MVTVIAKYAFWIVICLPVIFAGCWFCVRLFKENKVINKELEIEKKKAEQAALERSIFEISYKNKYSGEK